MPSPAAEDNTRDPAAVQQQPTERRYAFALVLILLMVGCFASGAVYTALYGEGTEVRQMEAQDGTLTPVAQPTAPESDGYPGTRSLSNGDASGGHHTVMQEERPDDQ